MGAGGLAGILVEPVNGTRIGVTYASQVDMDFKQKPDLSGGGQVFQALDPRISTANLDYKDTWGFGLGTRDKVAPGWMWMLGFAFDTSPRSKRQRTPALPLDWQYRIGTGLQYALSDTLTLGGAYEYLNLGNADINRSRGPLAGTL